MQLPFAPPLAPMLAKAADDLPHGEGWLYEPKWDGFRTLVFRDGQPYAALGSPGSNAIVNAGAQVISNLLYFGLDPAFARSVLRIHCAGRATLRESRTPRA